MSGLNVQTGGIRTLTGKTYLKKTSDTKQNALCYRFISKF